MQYLTVSEVARPLGVRPKDISDLFYQRELSDDACPVVGGRRLIRPDYVPTIVAALKKTGCLKDPAVGDRQATGSNETTNVNSAVELSEGILPTAGKGVTRD